MTEKKSNYRSEIKWGNQQNKKERAQKDFKRNLIGLLLSSIVFFVIILMVLTGTKMSSNLSMMVMVASLTGVFFCGREMRILPKGQIIFSAVKAVLCLGMASAYVLMHKGLWDWMDFAILGILVGVVALDIPRVLKAKKELD